MNIKVLSIWERVRTSYWFVPTLMAVASILLAIATLLIDSRWVESGFSSQVGLVWGGGGAGARELLSTIAGSMITVAGVIFSIAVVAFMQASIQHGPHILRNSMRDRGNQVVLGTFIATFIYSILVLRTIRIGDELEFIPNISITVSVILALASIGVLIYFIHHATVSIQAPEIVSHVAKQLLKTVEEVFPANTERSPREHPHHEELERIHERFEREAVIVSAPRSGYLEAIDDRALMKLAVERGLVLLLEYRPGLFIGHESALVRVLPPDRMDRKLEKRLRKAFVIGLQRSYTQDVEFAVHQLVEIGLRALSPAVNDPFTTIICIDWLGAGLSRMAEREFPSRYRFDRNGNLRVITARPFTFAGMVDAAMNQLRQFSDKHVSIRIHLLETIAAVMAHTRTEEDRQALLRQAAMIERESHPNTPARDDLRDIEDQYREVISLGR